MFDTLLASNVAPRSQLQSGLAALFLHLAVVVGAISATATRPDTVQPEVRDPIRLDLSRPPMGERQPTPPTTRPSRPPSPPSPPVAPDIMPDIPKLDAPRFTAAPVDPAALSGILRAPESEPSAGILGPGREVLTAAEIDVLPLLTGHLRPRYPEASGARR